MFNRFSTVVVERLSAQATAVMLADLSGEPERTWRHRLQGEWKPSAAYLAQLNSTIDQTQTDRLVKKGGWEIDEARAIVAKRPSAQAGTPLPTADLIYTYSPRFGEYCTESIALASRFDQHCDRLGNAVAVGDCDAARTVLKAMLDWLLDFLTSTSDRASTVVLRSALGQATSMEGLLKAAQPLGTALAFHVLSCWDVEFCAGYFEGMQAQPLFPLVMPRFAPGIEIEPRTGRLLRQGQTPRQRVLEPATARLLDVVAFLLAWSKTGVLPQRLPRPKDFAEWCDEDLARVYSWRDGSTRFTPAQLAQLWTHVLEPDGAGIYPAIPTPLHVCATLWSPLLADGEEGVSLIDCHADYEKFWQINHDRLVAGGLRFGEQAWPACLVRRTATLASVFPNLPAAARPSD